MNERVVSAGTPWAATWPSTPNHFEDECQAFCRVVHCVHAIEGAFSRHEDVSHRVKWWRIGEQAQRGLAASLALAEQTFGPLADASPLGSLIAALAAHLATLPGLQVIA